jgi:hypothetical protein
MGDIAQCVTSGISVEVGIVGGSDADAIEYNDGGAPHHAFGMVCT